MLFVDNIEHHNCTNPKFKVVHIFYTNQSQNPRQNCRNLSRAPVNQVNTTATVTVKIKIFTRTCCNLLLSVAFSRCKTLLGYTTRYFVLIKTEWFHIFWVVLTNSRHSQYLWCAWFLSKAFEPTKVNMHKYTPLSIHPVTSAHLNNPQVIR